MSSSKDLFTSVWEMSSVQLTKKMRRKDRKEREIDIRSVRLLFSSFIARYLLPPIAIRLERVRNGTKYLASYCLQEHSSRF